MSGGKIATFVVLLLMGTGGLLYVAYRTADKSKTRRETTTEPPKSDRMTEEERLQYIEDSIRVTELTVGPDMMPDRDEPVPGLFRVKGIVTNAGDRKIDKITLAIYPKDALGKVLGSYRENIATNKGLAPSAVSEFSFQIPEKKEYAGEFDHALK